MKRYRLALSLAAIVLILLIFVPFFSAGISLLVDWMWFNHAGFREIYLTILKTQAGLSIYCGLTFLLLAGLNLWIARTVASRSGYLPSRTPFPAPKRFFSVFRGLLWLAILIAAWFIGQWSAGHWTDYLLATHAAHMAQTDPVFGISLSFYLFRLPFLFFLYDLGLIILVASFLAAGYMQRGDYLP